MKLRNEKQGQRLREEKGIEQKVNFLFKMNTNELEKKNDINSLVARH